MNSNQAKEIAEIISNDQLSEMFNNAKDGIKNWTETSIVNKVMTKGTAWNILASNFDVNEKYHIMAKINMIREFGNFLPFDMRAPKSVKGNFICTPVHQDPIFK